MRPKDKSLRGAVARVKWEDIPDPSPEWDAHYRQKEDNLTGNTFMHDEQFAYFYKKHGGNIAEVKRDIGWMSIQACYNRAMDLGLPAMGKAHGDSMYSIMEKVKIYDLLMDKGLKYKQAGKELGMPAAKVKSICESLNIEPYSAIGCTGKVFTNIFNYFGGCKQKVADLLGIPWYTVDRKCKELGLNTP